jgi:DNA-binding protein Fis
VQAAKLLGITRATLRKRIERFNIRRELAIS